MGFVFHAKELGLYSIANGGSLKIPNWGAIWSGLPFRNIILVWRGSLETMRSVWRLFPQFSKGILRTLISGSKNLRANLQDLITE